MIEGGKRCCQYINYAVRSTFVNISKKFFQVDCHNRTNTKLPKKELVIFLTKYVFHIFYESFDFPPISQVYGISLLTLSEMNLFEELSLPSDDAAKL